MKSIPSKYSLLFIFLLSFHKGWSQDSILVLQKTIPYKTVSLSVNNIGEIFLIDVNNQLKKLDNNGDSIGVFNKVSKYGMLTSIIARNPWKTILFYKDFSNILILDKYLNESSSINLRARNFFKIKAVESAYDNNIWLFDEQDQKLKKVDETGKWISETTDFRQLFPEAPIVETIKDRDGFVYLYDSSKGLFVFDYYGTYKNTFTFLNWKDFEVLGNNVYGFDEKNIYKYTQGSMHLEKYNLPKQVLGYTSVKAAGNKLYFLVNGLVYIYNLHK